MSSQNRVNRKQKLVKTLLAADSSEKMLKIFKKMEESRCFTQDELDFYCTPIADRHLLECSLLEEPKDFEKTLYLAKRSLKGMLSEFGKTKNRKIPCARDEKMNSITFVLFDLGGTISSNTNYHYVMDLAMPMGLIILGTVSCELGRYNESLSYFNWAERNLTMLLEKDCPSGCFLKKMEIIQRFLFTAKRIMGKSQESISHAKNMLECKEKRLEEGCVEIGEASEQVYGVCFGSHEFKEALPYCLKAIEIHRKNFGGESVKVAKMVRDLGIVYNGLGEYDKSMEQNQLAKSILKRMAPDSLDLVELELDEGSTLSGLGRYKEGFEVYKAVLSLACARETDRAQAFYGMAHASVILNKFADAKKYIRAAERIYEKKHMDPCFAAVGYELHSRMYEMMNDLETSISMIRKVLAVSKIPEWLLLKACLKLISLYFQAGKVKEGLPAMKDAVEKLKETFGPEHYEVGRCYGMLGQLYMTLAQEEMGVKFLEKAKEILEASRGPDHVDSLKASHSLALVYSRMRRAELAIKIEEEVVAGCKRLGPSGQELMSEAVQLLKKFKELNMDTQ